jgi:hypothetical protein
MKISSMVTVNGNFQSILISDRAVYVVRGEMTNALSIY